MFLIYIRFEEAESDCTEALSLDDRYVKAYSRRATARKELGRFKASMEGIPSSYLCSMKIISQIFSLAFHFIAIVNDIQVLIPDSEFAMRLEPNNQELRKQYAETKALYQEVSVLHL